MASKGIEQTLSSEETTQELIKQLLAKPESDEALDIELFGYPADYLDSPMQKRRLTLREYEEIEKTFGKYFSFDVLYVQGTRIEPGVVYRTSAPLMLLDFGMKKAYISAKKLRSLLDANTDKGRIVRYGRGEKFVIKLPTRLLLDNSDVS